MQEEWRDVVGYEGLYQVNNLGRCKSLDRVLLVKGYNRKDYFIIRKGRILSNKRTNKGGYIRHVLVKDGKSKQFCIHKLVAEAFIPNPENKPRVDHIDTNAKNNCVSNLRWATDSENRNNVLTAERNRKYSYKSKSVIREAFKKGMKEATFYSRLRRGWSIDDSINLPVQVRAL